MVVVVVSDVVEEGGSRRSSSGGGREGGKGILLRLATTRCMATRNSPRDRAPSCVTSDRCQMDVSC